MGKKKSKSPSSASPSKKQIKKEEETTSTWHPSGYDYKVDYNDHFETPLVAYQDVLPLLDGVFLDRMKHRQDHVLYDPYYCNGRTKRLLNNLGFEKVVHEKRDFYKDIQQQTLPQNYDTLITNPPYSDNHKERCLQLCIEQWKDHQRPFFLLMPNYVATKHYYKEQLGSCLQDVVYVVPAQPYAYDHPEGTGHAVPPFASLWFCCVGHDNISRVKASFDQQHADQNNATAPKLVSSLEELQRMGAISMGKRPNPRQRKKKRQQKLQQQSLQPPASSSLPTATAKSKASLLPSTQKKQASTDSIDAKSTTTPRKKNKKQKQSRYRDKSGTRTKTRF